MAKITLGKRPQFIEATISATLPDGTVGSIKARYKYRTRTEFGQMIDQRMAEARTEAPAEPADFSVANMQRQARDANAAYLLDILDGWDLDEELNVANLERLADELPGAVMAIMEDYRAACCEGRLGN